MIDLEHRAFRERLETMRSPVQTGTQQNDLARTRSDLARDGIVDGARAQRKMTPHTERQRIERRIRRTCRARRFFCELDHGTGRRRYEMLRDRIRRKGITSQPGETSPCRDELCSEAGFSFSQIAYVLRQIVHEE